MAKSRQNPDLGRNLQVLLIGLEGLFALYGPMSTELAICPETLRAANICPATYLATDFLNHYNEVAMLIDLLAIDPEVSEEVLDWSVKTYVDHFAHSGFRDRDLAIEAYHYADPELINVFEAKCADIDSKVKHIQTLLMVGDVDNAAPLGKLLFDDISILNAMIIGPNDDLTRAPTTEATGNSQSEIDSLFD